MIITIIMPHYKSGKSIMTAACYKDGKSIITSLIIMKISFVCFKEDEIDKSGIRSHARSYARSRARSHDHRSYNYGIIRISSYYLPLSFCIQGLGAKTNACITPRS